MRCVPGCWGVKIYKGPPRRPPARWNRGTPGRAGAVAAGITVERSLAWLGLTLVEGSFQSGISHDCNEEEIHSDGALPQGALVRVDESMLRLGRLHPTGHPERSEGSRFVRRTENATVE